MEPLLTIDPRSLPAEGRRLKGILPSELVAIPETPTIRSTGPVEYDLFAVRDEDNVVISGSLTAPFSLDCVRCIAPFDCVIEIDDYEIEVPIENDQMIDLTEALREDILLALPSYPRCEDGNVDPRDCPAEGLFEPNSDNEPDQAPAEGKTAAWDVLDKLK